MKKLVKKVEDMMYWEYTERSASKEQKEELDVLSKAQVAIKSTTGRSLEFIALEDATFSYASIVQREAFQAGFRAALKSVQAHSA